MDVDRRTYVGYPGQLAERFVPKSTKVSYSLSWNYVYSLTGCFLSISAIGCVSFFDLFLLGVKCMCIFTDNVLHGIYNLLPFLYLDLLVLYNIAY